MNKVIIFFILILLLTGCNKESKIVITQFEATNKDKIDISDDKKKPLKVLSKDDELIICVRSDGAPGMFLNGNSEVEGFYVDLEKAVMKEMDQKYKFVSYSDLSVTIQKIKMGIYHSALATVDVPDYRLFSNISTPFEKLDFVIFLPDFSNEIVPDNKYDAIRFLYGKKIGVQTRGHIYQLLRDHPEIKILEYPTTTKAMEALHNGDVDAVPEVERIGMHYANDNNWKVKPVGPVIFTLNIGTGFSKTLDQSVVYRYNKALQKLIDNGYVEKLHNEYYDNL